MIDWILFFNIFLPLAGGVVILSLKQVLFKRYLISRPTSEKPTHRLSQNEEYYTGLIDELRRSVDELRTSVNWWKSQLNEKNQEHDQQKEENSMIRHEIAGLKEEIATLKNLLSESTVARYADLIAAVLVKIEHGEYKTAEALIEVQMNSDSYLYDRYTKFKENNDAPTVRNMDTSSAVKQSAAQANKTDRSNAMQVTIKNDGGNVTVSGRDTDSG